MADKIILMLGKTLFTTNKNPIYFQYNLVLLLVQCCLLLIKPYLLSINSYLFSSNYLFTILVTIFLVEQIHIIKVKCNKGKCKSILHLVIPYRLSIMTHLVLFIVLILGLYQHQKFCCKTYKIHSKLVKTPKKTSKIAN